MTHHVLAGCGSFMAGLSSIMGEMDLEVKAYDKTFQAPMRNQLEHAGIEMVQGYDGHPAIPSEDTLIIGNAICRGNPMLERHLQEGKSLMSGPQWLHDKVLKTRKTVAISGTHGKTTTTAMMAWVLESCQQKPGYLLGGIPLNFNTSARLGGEEWFVIEADEYDTVYYDKRPKFFYYPAHCLIINNLEFDHADIYRDLADIEKQFKHYLQTLKPGAWVIYPKDAENIAQLVEAAGWVRGCPVSHVKEGAWHIKPQGPDWSSFQIKDDQGQSYFIEWDLFGQHNAQNALMVFTAAMKMGMRPEDIVKGISTFKGVARRMQKIGESHDNKVVYDDFAHHPTALQMVIEATRARFAMRRLVVFLQLSNYTQREGVMWERLQKASEGADLILLLQNDSQFPYHDFAAGHKKPVELIPAIFTKEDIRKHIKPGDHILTCSSRDCHSVHQAILQA